MNNDYSESNINNQNVEELFLLKDLLNKYFPESEYVNDETTMFVLKQQQEKIDMLITTSFS